MALALKPLEDLRRGGQRREGLKRQRTPASETAIALGTLSFVFISSTDPRNPKTLVGKRREDGAYVLSVKEDGVSRVIGLMVRLESVQAVESARKPGEELWGSLDTLSDCLSDGRICLIKGVNPHLFAEHFVLKKGVYKDVGN
ncbi:MAG: hypothetical protein AABW86_01610 [Candidatus Micrarchaeota archaeon]